ncbi:MAG: isochorismatase family protein [Alphaproteobacteria bacterium]|nr:isochorismatase family protein [Alphaproteobacteria bacterium]
MSAELEVYQRQSFGRTLGLGRLAGLLVVDFVNGFNDPALFGGGNIGPAIERTVDLLASCRRMNLPIAFTRIVFEADGSDHNLFVAKVPALGQLTEPAVCSQIVPQLRPRPGELVVRKRLPSAFFGTDLAAWFTARGVDTLLIVGCTTSGCVRASVLDALCHGFRPIVITDCVGDRAIAPHDANLFDLGQKYADLLSRDAVMNALRAPQRHLSASN